MLRDGNAPPVVTSRVARIAAHHRRDAAPAAPPRARQRRAPTRSWPPPPTTCPEAVGGYLRLPREWADTRPIDGYKTSLMVLVDQLELLGSTMDKILDAANRADAQALIAHGRFLQAKFGHDRRTRPHDPRGVPP